MVEKYTDKKNISGVVVWLVICFFIASLIAILLTELITYEKENIEASADFEEAPYNVTEPVLSFEHYPELDTSILSTSVYCFHASYNPPPLLNPFDASGFNLEFFLDVSPIKNQLLPYNALGIKMDVTSGTYPAHRYQAGGWFPLSSPHLKIMTACSHTEYQPTIQIHYYGANRTYIQSQAFQPLIRYVPNKVIWQEYDASLYAPSGAIEWVWDIDFSFDTGGEDTRYYLFPALNFQTSTYGVRTSEFIIECFDYWYGVNEEQWRRKYLHQLQINDMMAEGNTLEGTLANITATPINLLKDLMSFEIEILGINIKQLLIFVFSLAVVGVVIKIIIGRS